jgi:hypothetical protein
LFLHEDEDEEEDEEEEEDGDDDKGISFFVLLVWILRSCFTMVMLLCTYRLCRVIGQCGSDQVEILFLSFCCCCGWIEIF